MAFTLNNVPLSAICSKQIALMPSTTITSTTTSTGTLIGIDTFSVAELMLKVGTVSGTSPTLDVYIQKLLPDGSTWDDLIHFTQATGTANYVATAVVGNAGVHTQAVRSLAASTVQTTTLGNTWRIDAVVGGSTPSFVFQVFGDFYV